MLMMGMCDHPENTTDNKFDMSSHAIQHRLKLITLFLKDYKWLIDAYLSDYFIVNHIQHINPLWWETLKNMDLRELASFLQPGQWEGRSVWPLSLLAFKSFAHGLPLSRSPVDAASYIDKLSSQTYSERSSSTAVPSPCGDKNYEKSNDTKEAEMGLETQYSDRAKCSSTLENSDKPCTGSSGNEDEANVTEEIQDGQYLLLEHCYRRHVKPKKQHEILILAKVIQQLASQAGCEHVIDVGAGQGHLSRLLSFGYGLNVTTIEAASCHAPKATKFDGEVKRDISRGQCISRKKRKKMHEASEKPLDVRKNAPEPSHVVAWIDSDISVGQFLRRVREATLPSAKPKVEEQICHASSCNELASEHLIDNSYIGAAVSADADSPIGKRKDLTHNKENSSLDSSGDCSIQEQREYMHSLYEEAPLFILTGLHACGDLTPTMLRVFVSCPEAQGLVSVGCCYMKMDIHEANRGEAELGYPLSGYVSALDNHALSWEAREMACHFIDAYYERLIESVAHLRTHCYRAALQEVIRDKDPGVQHGSVKLTLKKTHRLPFDEYASKALSRLGLDSTLSDEQLQRSTERLNSWREVVAFYVLRLSLAPLLETLVLLDRALYLIENGIKTTIIPVFNPAISPRNFVLLAAK